jgi:D-alanyl-D-alanine carboxypeptidase/D-alanyl-D-alanine-endopeptidase (penicillin-binding protein 4)
VIVPGRLLRAEKNNTLPQDMIVRSVILTIVMACSSFTACLAQTALAGPERTPQTLPRPVSAILSAYKMPLDTYSVYVQAVGYNEPLLAVNPDMPRNPASTIKLLTTFLALEDLGPTYRWKTEAYRAGELNDGSLDGDLFLKGYGDPYLVTERFWLFLQQLRRRGLDHVLGDLVIDNSYFDLEPADTGEFDGQAFRAYNVVPDALLVNFKAIRFVFLPDPVTNQVQVIADPMPANLEIENNLKITGNRCRGYQNGIAVAVSAAPLHERVTFSGNYGRTCPEYSISRSALQASTFAYGVFRTLWEQSGGTLKGGVRTAVVPENIELLATMDSPPLSEVIRSVNKWSNNVMARHLLLTMGAERFGPPATVAKGRDAATMILSERGLNFPELNLDNGAGLSRDTRISARNLAQLLLDAGSSNFNAEFVSSLALSGLDGTMRRRFRNEELTGRMHLKTGRLKDVYAMAGYVRSQSGKDYVVVAFQNADKADRGPGEEAHSALLRWVYLQ